MNCFEARNDFAGFWRKTLTIEQREDLRHHLRECTACDHAFRTFALTAPVLYSGSEARADYAPQRAPRLHSVGVRSWRDASAPADRRHLRTLSRVLPGFVLAAAAAAVALHFATPPRMTFEDAIAADNSNAEVVSYPATDNFFGQELLAQDTSGQDLSND
jgi:anti-sigma factor RsiW